MREKLLNWLQYKLGITDLRMRLDRQRVLINNLISILGKETIVGTDVHMKSSSFVIIFTRAAGGQIRFMNVEIKSMMDLKRLEQFLSSAYGVIDRDTFYDLPAGWPPRRTWYE